MRDRRFFVALLVIACCNSGRCEDAKDQQDALNLGADDRVSLIIGVPTPPQPARKVYIVNKSGKTVYWPRHKGDIQLRLEVWDEANKRWLVGQTSSFASVGYSDGTLSTVDGATLECRAWCPAKGRPRRMRYRIRGDLEIISREFSGRISTSQLIQARFHPANIRHAELQVIQSILLHPFDVPVEITRDHRVAALERLSEFEDEHVESVLTFLLDQSEDPLDLKLIIPALHRIKPEIVIRRMLKALESDPRSRAQERLLMSRALDGLNVPAEVLAALEVQCQNRDSVLLPCYLCLAGRVKSKHPERQKKMLQNAAKDPLLRADVRTLARVELGRNFVPRSLEVKLVSNPRSLLGPAITISIKNLNSEPVQFSYTHYSEFLSLYLQEGDEVDYPARLFVPRSRRSGANLGPGVRNKNEFFLPKGGSLSLNVRIGSFFHQSNIPVRSNRSLRLLVGCKVMGRGDQEQIQFIGRLR